MEKEDKFIDILNWAYDKAHNGFTDNELKNQFKLESEQWEWAKMIFLPQKDNENSLIRYITYKKEQNLHWYAISDKGISVIISERQLKEATESSAKAMKIATYSLWIAIASFVVATIINIVQIFIQICFK